MKKIYIIRKYHSEGSFCCDIALTTNKELAERSYVLASFDADTETVKDEDGQSRDPEYMVLHIDLG